MQQASFTSPISALISVCPNPLGYLQLRFYYASSSLPMVLAESVVAHSPTGSLDLSSGMSRSVPRAKSHLVIPTSSPLGLLHCPLLGLPKLHLSVPITPNQVPWASPSHI